MSDTNMVPRIHKSLGRALLTVAAWLALATPIKANAAILLEEGGKSVRSRISFKTAEDGYSLRRLRRVGVGVSALGALGVGGVNLELCFNPESGFIGGFGGGKGFQAFTLQYKRVLGGQNFLPYFTGGFSRWYSVGQPSPITESTAPSILADRLLTDHDKARGIFGVNLVHPGLGLQVVQPSGPYAGASVYVEALMLLSLDTFVAAPTGSLGFLYYF